MVANGERLQTTLAILPDFHDALDLRISLLVFSILQPSIPTSSPDILRILMVTN